MLTSDLMENIKNVTALVEFYFGENVTSFFITTDENEQDFCVDCLIYRSFLVSFTVGDVSKGGVFGINVSIGNRAFSLDILSQYKEDIPVDIEKNAINKNLEILDNYLQWRMTDEQRKTFGLI